VRIFNTGNILPALALVAASASAQSGAVPGRDLLSFPLGQVAEGGALPGMLGLGLFNPAAARLASDSVWRIGAAAMNTPNDISATGQVGGVGRSWRGVTFTASVMRSAVTGLLRTDSDPLSIGHDVPYLTDVISIGAATRRAKYITVGAALRVHSGEIDSEHRSALVTDVGFVADSLPLDLRIAGSTFLWSPLVSGAEGPTLLLGADFRVAQRDSTKVARLGASFSNTPGRFSEQLLFASARYDAWELRGGPVRTTAYGATNVRLRLGFGVHYGSYVVGLAREEAPSGLGASYQFVLSTIVR
jgi:hypothetical protein